MSKKQKVNKEKEHAKSILAPVPHERKFYCSDGKVFSTLEDLEKSLAYISPQTFSFHVNKEKNDFANWIKDVVLDIKLAASIKHEKNQEIFNERIKNRFYELKNIAK